ncbi:MAG TPA: non-homologous end-joining DNA ligase [Chthoniobacterales bacterium]|jgi:bifunctional non-homologous end joining protein LigD|nr:non-homologous end-joining DNA ligase [Chthoniobacterales bacterium]
MAESTFLKIGGRRVPISNPDKVFYNAGKFTQLDVVNYYLRVAPYLLPHFKNRPVTLKRYPNGVHGELFYEKDAPAYTPDWVKTFPVPRREGGPDINYIVINDRATLAWAANAAALELHPFLHRVPQLDRPTHVVFDLDPGEGAALPECIEVALILRDVLTKLKLKSFPKVSGSKGIQIYVPLNTPSSYGATQLFAKTIAELLEREHPGMVVAEMSKNLRHNKVFIDWSQNADHKTTVGVYSLRAKSNHPYVSMPVRWSELTRKTRTEALYFEAADALKRLKNVGDLFAPVLTLKQKLPREFEQRAGKSPGRSRAPRAAFGASPEASGKKSGARGRTPQHARARALPGKALAEYEAKRHFDRTAEPGPTAPRRSRQGSRRRFVIQKHAASHLHYDFRLEMNDVLKSWAVPKNLSFKEGETRTGFETEDHPIDYLEFEGIIPEGEYGGGTVMVWDIGTYEVVDGNYWKGALTVFLSGKKLKGEWALKRMAAEDGKPKWFINKTNGDARPIPTKRESVSVLTGRSMEKIAGEKSTVWNSDRGRAEARPSGRVGALRRPGRRSAASLPKFVKPMKATAVTEFPKEGDWIYEIKWDGYRALGLKHGDKNVQLLSLKEKNLTTDFPTVAEAMRDLRAESALIDGEIVAVDAQGRPSFQVLQNRKTSGRDWTLVYYAFDLLNLEGEDLQALPLHERKARLKKLIAETASPVLRYNAELAGTPAAVIRTVARAGLEGVIAKKRDSVYRAGTRLTTWLKLKLNKSQEFVIGGYKPDAGSFQSILVGYYEGKDLVFAGKVRQGFNPAGRARLLKEMKPFPMTRCPFSNLPTSRKSHFGEGITEDEMAELCWLKPKLVAQVSFTEWTTYGLLRHATFEGLRDDKAPGEIVREIAR